MARELTRTRDAGAGKPMTYPQSKLGQQLGVVSQLIKSCGAGTAVSYYTSQTGYDAPTHAQLPQHADDVKRKLLETP